MDKLPNPFIQDPYAQVAEMLHYLQKLAQTEALIGEEVTHADFQGRDHGMYPVHPEHRFVLDADRLLSDIDAPPKFITDPSREFLIGCGLSQVVDILDGH